MLAILLKIMSIIGIVLLILLGLLLVVFLLVLFCPVYYQIKGEIAAEDNSSKDNSFQKRIKIEAKAHWLFGVLRANYHYPHSKQFVVKLLFFTLYPFKKKRKRDKIESMLESEEDKLVSESNTDTKEVSKTDEKRLSTDTKVSKPDKKGLSTDTKVSKPDEKELSTSTKVLDTENTDTKESEHNTIPMDSKTSFSWWERLLEKLQKKYQKILYTIRKICDKIKHVLENGNYYKTLFMKEETKQLFTHAGLRFGKVWKSIKPRKIQANIRFGTGSPDTTGYCFGIYGMLMPYLGKNVTIIPNFEKAELEGEWNVKGHFMIVTILLHGIYLLLDKRLRLFIRRLKKQEER